MAVPGLLVTIDDKNYVLNVYFQVHTDAHCGPSGSSMPPKVLHNRL